MNTRRHRFVFGILAMLVGCVGGHGDDERPKDPNAGPPEPVTTTAACIISADCPAGTHCDLGECVQTCNTVDPCTGETTCSPRGRCVGENEKDQDPAPVTTKIGAVRAEQAEFLLTDRDTKVSVKLTSDSTAPVRYRVELKAPHLRIAESRGEFTGSTTLTFDVVTAGLKGRDIAGSIRIVTTLGEVVVNAPIHVGLTGTYQGALRYDGGPAHLGDVQLALDILESGGEAKVRVDSKRSLLFPATSAGETTGRGSFTPADGLDVTLAQRIPKTLGGDRNHFGRDLGRKVHLKVKPDSQGNLAGTFEETIYGLFANPVTVKGTVLLNYQPQGKDPEFALADEPTMPAAPSKDVFLGPDKVFGWTGGTCDATVCTSTSCATGAATAARIDTLATTYAQPLNDSVIGRKDSSSDDPFGDIASRCRKSFGTTTISAWTADAEASKCTLLPVVACSLPVAAKFSPGNIDLAKRVHRMTASALAPALLVAKDEVVKALTDSFVSGPAKESSRYDAAMTALGPASTWVLQPAVLEYLKSTSSSAAKGDALDTATTQGDTYPAARALADMLQTTGMIDGERARIAASATAEAQPELAQKAQERAVLTFLESTALLDLLETWGTAPPTVTVKLTGVLTPLDQGWNALALGANIFGVPSTYVPFVYRPEDVAKGPTNFEQMFGLAKESVAAEQEIESTFLGNKRTYDKQVADLNAQFSGLRTNFDTRIRDICGTSFDPNTVTKLEDWARCGTGAGGVKEGEAGVLLLEIDAANARIRSAQSRMSGIRDKIGIDYKRIQDVYAVRADSMQFIASTGEKLAILTFTTGVIDAATSFVTTGAHANMLNFGSPYVNASIAAVLQTLKAGLEAQKSRLQTAQTLKLEAAGAQVEVINGMADIQKQTIDLAQAAVDLQQELIAMIQAQVRVRNAVTSAKALHEERERQRVLTSKDPSNDPSFRLLRDKQGFSVLKARAEAQRQLYLAARALAYETNSDIKALDGAALGAHDGASLKSLQNCLSGIYAKYRESFGSPQDYVATVSVRKMLGIAGPRVDAVTGEELNEGAQFRRYLLQNANLDGRGGVGITFSTNLQPGNGLWATDVCTDKVSTVQAQIVGDFLGDNQAQINLSLAGASFLRSCDSESVTTWSLGRGGDATGAFAVVQAGVNTFGDATPNTSLFGQSVARATWRLVIPGGTAAPANSDLQLDKIEDVVLKLGHKALPRRSTPVSLDLSCLATSGG